MRLIFWHNKFIMLGTDNYCVDTQRFIIIVILNSDLRFAVGSQIFHLFAFVSYCGQFLKKPVSQLNCERHVVIHFTTGIAEHHSLVASSLFFRFISNDALIYIT